MSQGGYTASALSAIDSIGVKLPTLPHFLLPGRATFHRLSQISGNLPFGWDNAGVSYAGALTVWVAGFGAGLALLRFVSCCIFQVFLAFLSSFNLQILSRQIRKNGVFFGPRF
ncbi:hypothetical protein IAS59_000928 [Cryptococcus gattii]